MKKIRTIADLEKHIEKQLEGMILPFDYVGIEAGQDIFSEYVSFLKEEGFLTEDMKPTKKAIDWDYLRTNDGSIHFSEFTEQPELLITGYAAIRTLQLFDDMRFLKKLTR